MPMLKLIPKRKFARAMLFAASVSIFAGSSPSAMGQQSADQQRAGGAPAGATIDAATAAAIARFVLVDMFVSMMSMTLGVIT